jgi:hypothetical protein
LGLVPILAVAWLATADAAAPAPAPPPTAAAETDPEGGAAGPAIPDDGPDQQAVIASAYQAAEAMQGPLDGLWRVTDEAGRILFIFDLSDPGGPPAPLAATPSDPGVEGAWRDPSGAGSPNAFGFIDKVRHEGARLSIRFVEEPGDRAEVLTLSPSRDGRWAGELAGAGARQAIVMAKF